MSRIVGTNDRGLRVGEDHQRATLTDIDVERIRELRAEGLTYQRLAEIFECSKAHIRDIVKFRKRATTPTQWRRVG